MQKLGLVSWIPPSLKCKEIPVFGNAITRLGLLHCVGMVTHNARSCKGEPCLSVSWIENSLFKRSSCLIFWALKLISAFDNYAKAPEELKVIDWTEPSLSKWESNTLYLKLTSIQPCTVIHYLLLFACTNTSMLFVQCSTCIYCVCKRKKQSQTIRTLQQRANSCNGNFVSQLRRLVASNSRGQGSIPKQPMWNTGNGISFPLPIIISRMLFSHQSHPTPRIKQNGLMITFQTCTWEVSGSSLCYSEWKLCCLSQSLQAKAGRISI